MSKIAHRIKTFAMSHPRLETAVLALRRFGEHRMSVHAGNFAYSAFLALMPLLLLFLSAMGFLFRGSPGTMERVVSSLSRSQPELRSLIEEAAGGTERFRGLLGMAGLLGLAWGSSRLIHSLRVGFAEIWGYQPRPSLTGRLRALPLLFLLVSAAVTGMVVSLLAATLMARAAIGLGLGSSPLVRLLGPLFSVSVSLFIITPLYRWGPRARPGWREAFIAAVTASLILEAAQIILGFYFEVFTARQALLGTLGIAFGVILWLYIAGLTIFYGAELAAVLQEKGQRLLESERVENDSVRQHGC